MDPETEKHLAAMLMEEATKLRLQADKGGVHVYLHEPKVRGRPNSRFLTATVLGVQQANRIAEVNEMWRVRKKELELDDRLRAGSKVKSRSIRHCNDADGLERSTSQGRTNKVEADKKTAVLCTTSKHGNKEDDSTDDGLRDDEIEDFLRSRAKRGRGSVGSRMDEPAPCLPSTSSDYEGKPVANPNLRLMEEWERLVLGSDKPLFLRSCERAQDVVTYDESKADNLDKVSSKKQHRSKEDKASYKKKKRKEKRSKHLY